MGLGREKQRKLEKRKKTAICANRGVCRFVSVDHGKLGLLVLIQHHLSHSLSSTSWQMGGHLSELLL